MAQTESFLCGVFGEQSDEWAKKMQRELYTPFNGVELSESRLLYLSEKSPSCYTPEELREIQSIFQWYYNANLVPKSPEELMQAGGFAMGGASFQGNQLMEAKKYYQLFQNYQSALQSTNMLDHAYLQDKEKLEQYFDLYYALSGMVGQDVVEMEVDEVTIEQILEWLDKTNSVATEVIDGRQSIRFLMDGVMFSAYTENGKQFIKIAGSGVKDMTWSQLENYLSRNIKDVDWRKFDLKQLTKRDGMDINGQRAHSYFDDIKYDDLESALDSLRENRTALKNMSSTFGNTFMKELNVLDDFNIGSYKNLSTWGKVGKGLGAVGTGLTIIGNVQDNFIENGEFSISVDQTQDFITDTAVDIGTGALSMSTGAAVGSLFLPPLGTAVGAVAGLAIGTALNWDFVDMDGDGEKDSLVDGVKMGVDYICDSVGDFFSDIFW